MWWWWCFVVVVVSWWRFCLVVGVGVTGLGCLRAQDVFEEEDQGVQVIVPHTVMTSEEKITGAE